MQNILNTILYKKIIMNILLTLIILLLSFSVVADDISEFEIEGMSIGDSLLEYYSVSEIRNAPNYNDLPSDMKFTIIEMPKKGRYDALQFYYLTDNQNYNIAAVSGGMFMGINQCTKDQKKIADEISSTMNNITVNGPFESKHQDDPSGDSYFIRYELYLNGGYTVIDCYSFAKHTGWKDNFRISIVNNQVKDWINNNFGSN